MSSITHYLSRMKNKEQSGPKNYYFYIKCELNYINLKKIKNQYNPIQKKLIKIIYFIPNPSPGNQISPC